MEGKKTVNIQVQTAGNDSTTMVLHISTDGRCSLKKGWTNFAVQNNLTSKQQLVFYEEHINALCYHRIILSLQLDCGAPLARPNL
uniref:TF-B3 domain-containing protein n=1 Tax=Oryza rufipogon TaxID=4529 RepID=A0A0E0RAD9_ORYRU